MAVRAARLPGIRFETQPPPPLQILPRMDIAAFIGFATAGPLNVPVVVDDAAHFQAVFGEDVLLAWDELRGEMEPAYLGPAVRAFFRGGGRRCYVIRVAGSAESSLFNVPGMLREDEDGVLHPAYIQARSPGSWADGLHVSGETLLLPLNLLDLRPLPDPAAGIQAELGLAHSGDLQVGDLLRFTFKIAGERYQLMLPVTTVSGLASGSMGSARVRVTGAARWFRLPGMPKNSEPGLARVFPTTALETEAIPWTTAWLPDHAAWEPGKPVDLTLDLAPDQAPPSGSLVQALLGGERLWLVVLSAQSVRGTVPSAGMSVKDHLVISAMGAWETASPGGWLSAGVERFVERLRMHLNVGSSGDAAANRLTSSDMGFSAAHPRYWNGLPTDDVRYRPLPLGKENPYDGLWRSSAEGRFPLAGLPSLRDTVYPLPLPSGVSMFGGALHSRRTTLERDGLDQFSVDLFLDPLLQDSGVETLIASADYLTYQSPAEHEPTGIYAVLRLEEATLIAAPDVLHTGWARDTTRPEQPQPSPPPLPDMNCTPSLPENKTGQFGELSLLGRPVLSMSELENPNLPFRASWTPVSGPVTRYRIEEAGAADFSDAAAVYVGPNRFFDLSGRSTGVYFYRVRAESAAQEQPGEWSAGVGVRLGAARPWKTLPAAAFAEDALARFHQALLTLCAARGDLFAVLGLPVFFHEDSALRYAARLKSMPGGPSARTLSFGALYHPWLFIQEESPSARVILSPADGAAAGVIVRRTLARGAWLAPANELLSGVMALQPKIAASRLLDLQEGAVNIIRQEPRGFITFSEFTLSTEEELRQIHVRRLLMLLRRLALREGNTYVFEPNSPAFRRQVQRGFEEILSALFQRGAFGGDTPDTSYQVDAGDRPNPPGSGDLGRLVVDIRVAPSQPLMFLTVRLVLTGARDLQILEGVS